MRRPRIDCLWSRETGRDFWGALGIAYVLGDGLKVVQDGHFWCDGLSVGFLGVL